MSMDNVPAIAVPFMGPAGPQTFDFQHGALARRSGKTLIARSREDIKRTCELLASAGDELDDLLDELPPPAAPERAARWSCQRES